MFRRLSEPLQLSEASLLALRPALNAPVLTVDYLPVGPARAAVVVFAEEYGGVGLAIGIRSNDGGQIVVLRNQEPIDASRPVSETLEPALAQAERMGFLFDEDMVEGTPGGKGRAQAMALWGRLMGEIEMPPPPQAAEPEPAATEPVANRPGQAVPTGEVDPGELTLFELDEIAPLDSLPEIELEPFEELDDVDPAGVSTSGADPGSQGRAAGGSPKPPSQPAANGAGSASGAKAAPAATGRSRKKARAGRAAAAISSQQTEPLVDDETPRTRRRKAAAEPPRPRLSKFRNAAAEDEDSGSVRRRRSAGSAEDAGADGGNQLARIPIVQVRRERDNPKRAPFLARLLSSF